MTDGAMQAIVAQVLAARRYKMARAMHEVILRGRALGPFEPGLSLHHTRCVQASAAHAAALAREFSGNIDDVNQGAS